MLIDIGRNYRAHCTDLLNDVYIGHAKAALEEKEYERSESYLLRANRADIILKYVWNVRLYTLRLHSYSIPFHF